MKAKERDLRRLIATELKKRGLRPAPPQPPSKLRDAADRPLLLTGLPGVLPRANWRRTP